MPRTSRSSLVVSAAALALAGLLAPASIASAAPLTYPAVVDEGVTVVSPYPNYDIEVNCDEFIAQYVIDENDFIAELYHVPGGSLRITFDCELADLGLGSLSTMVTGGTAESTVEGGVTEVLVDPNTVITATFTGSDAAFEVDYYPTAELPDPTGTRLHEVNVDYSGDVALFGVDESALVYDCISDTEQRPYMTQVFTVLTEGTYTFRFVGYLPYEGGLDNSDSPFDNGTPPNPWGTTNPWSDPVLAVYNNFTPSNTDAGVIECNDDSEASEAIVDDTFGGRGGVYDTQNRFLYEYMSELTLTLSPGTYTLVTMPYDDPQLADVSASKDGGLAPAYVINDLDASGELSAQIDVWGQEGGLVLGAQLAATGVETDRLGILALAALTFALFGAAVMVRRRRA